MKEHYVSYECAVALKRLGFDWECDHFYQNRHHLSESTIYGQTFEVSDYWHNFNDYDPDHHRQVQWPECSAPRLDQAAAWMREEKGIHISVNPYMGYDVDADGALYNEYPSWGFELMNVAKADFLDDAGGNHPSYESALSAGIDKALELLGKEVKE